jgi:hypothetical protein
VAGNHFEWSLRVSRLLGRDWFGAHACTLRKGDSDACISGRFLATSVSGNAGRLTSPSSQLWGSRRTPRHGTRTILVGVRRETRTASSRGLRKAGRPPRSIRCETSALTALQVWRAPLAHRLYLHGDFAFLLSPDFLRDSVALDGVGVPARQVADFPSPNSVQW